MDERETSVLTFPQPQSYPRNLVPGGPSCKMRLTRLSPSFRGGGAVGRWSLLIHTQQKWGRRKIMNTPFRSYSHMIEHTLEKSPHTPETGLQ